MDRKTHVYEALSNGTSVMVVESVDERFQLKRVEGSTFFPTEIGAGITAGEFQPLTVLYNTFLVDYTHPTQHSSMFKFGFDVVSWIHGRVIV